MTGHLLSSGVPIFREPATVGARRTLTALITILAALLVGVALLAGAYGIAATPPGRERYRSPLSPLVAPVVVGRGAIYKVTLASAVAVLALSANTSFADFPRLCRLVVTERCLPGAFMHRGRHLAFPHGILVVSGRSAVLLGLFGRITDALIPRFTAARSSRGARAEASRPARAVLAHHEHDQRDGDRRHVVHRPRVEVRRRGSGLAPARRDDGFRDARRRRSRTFRLPRGPQIVIANTPWYPRDRLPERRTHSWICWLM